MTDTSPLTTAPVEADVDAEAPARARRAAGSWTVYVLLALILGWIWVLDRGGIVERDAAGRPTRMVGVQTDITPQKATESELQAMNERVRLALEASDIGIALGWSWGMRNLVATGNMVRKTGIGISVSLVPKERNALIANNVIAEAKLGAVVGTEYGKAVTGDLTKAEDRRAAGVRVESNAVG